MTLRIDIGWLLTCVLVSVRVAAATMLAPVFGPARIPSTVKVLIGLALSVFMVSVLATPTVQSVSVVGLAGAMLHEALLGLAFGFGFMAAQAATQVAGRALDIQLGFGAASILNPTTQTPSPLVGSLFGILMVAAFLTLNGHHVLIEALAASLNSMPPGAMAFSDFDAVIRQSSVMFTFGLALAAPVMFMLWLADVAMAVFARSMPQLNVFLLSFAVKILLGVLGLAMTISITRALFGSMFDSMFHYWGGLADSP